MRKKFGLSCNHTVREPACVALAALAGYPTTLFVSLIRAGSQKAQLIHNAQVQAIDTDAIAADEIWSFVEKNTSSLSARRT